MKYLLSYLFILPAAISHAQTGPATEWHFGVKADLNYTNLTGNGTASGFTTGGQGGIYAERALGKQWSVQPEILFTQSNTKKGSDFLTYYNVSGNPFAAEDIKLAYASIPVLIKYNFNKHFCFLIGPQYSILLKDAESLLIKGNDKAFKHSEFSGNAGAQFTIGKVSLYGRYNIGLSNINNIDDRYKWHSNHIQGGIAVRIM